MDVHPDGRSTTGPPALSSSQPPGFLVKSLHSISLSDLLSFGNFRMRRPRTPIEIGASNPKYHRRGWNNYSNYRLIDTISDLFKALDGPYMSGLCLLDFLYCCRHAIH